MRLITTQLAPAPSPSKRDSTPSCFSLGKHHPSAGCPLLIRTVAACLIVISAALLTGCADGGGGAASASMTSSAAAAPPDSSTSSAAGVTATLAWDPVPDPTVSGYYVHYGKTIQAAGSCAYEDSQFVPSTTPTATVTNLDRNTTYYFVVSAYNGIESDCSSEVTATTPI